MRRQFEQEMEQLHTHLIEMGAMCERAIDEAQRVLLENDADAAEALILGDNEIDNKEKEIEHQCLKLMLRQQPVASDLRRISVAMKLITDMERIGDQAADIAEIVKTGNILSGEAEEICLGNMAEATKHMVTASIDAFVKEDKEKATDVIRYDDVVDRLFDETREALIRRISANTDGGWDASQILDLLMVAKYYERIGDHATNIAEWVIFGITGEHINEYKTSV